MKLFYKSKLLRILSKIRFSNANFTFKDIYTTFVESYFNIKISYEEFIILFKNDLLKSNKFNNVECIKTNYSSYIILHQNNNINNNESYILSNKYKFSLTYNKQLNKLYNYNYLKNIYKDKNNSLIRNIYKAILDINSQTNHNEIYIYLNNICSIDVKDIKNASHYCKFLNKANRIVSDLSQKNVNEKLLYINKSFIYNLNKDIDESFIDDNCSIYSSLNSIYISKKKFIYVDNIEYKDYIVMLSNYIFYNSYTPDNNTKINNIIFYLLIYENGLSTKDISLLINYKNREKSLNRMLNDMEEKNFIFKNPIRLGKIFQYVYVINYNKLEDINYSKALVYISLKLKLTIGKNNFKNFNFLNDIYYVLNNIGFSLNDTKITNKYLLFVYKYLGNVIVENLIYLFKNLVKSICNNSNTLKNYKNICKDQNKLIDNYNIYTKNKHLYINPKYIKILLDDLATLNDKNIINCFYKNTNIKAYNRLIDQKDNIEKTNLEDIKKSIMLEYLHIKLENKLGKKSFSDISFKRLIYTLNKIDIYGVLSVNDIRNYFYNEFEKNEEFQIDRKTIINIITKLKDISFIKVLEYEISMINVKYNYSNKDKVIYKKIFALRLDVNENDDIYKNAINREIMSYNFYIKDNTTCYYSKNNSIQKYLINKNKLNKSSENYDYNIKNSVNNHVIKKFKKKEIAKTYLFYNLKNIFNKYSNNNSIVNYLNDIKYINKIKFKNNLNKYKKIFFKRLKEIFNSNTIVSEYYKNEALINKICKNPLNIVDNKNLDLFIFNFMNKNNSKYISNINNKTNEFDQYKIMFYNNFKKNHIKSTEFEKIAINKSDNFVLNELNSKNNINNSFNFSSIIPNNYNNNIRFNQISNNCSLQLNKRLLCSKYYQLFEKLFLNRKRIIKDANNNIHNNIKDKYVNKFLNKNINFELSLNTEISINNIFNKNIIHKNDIKIIKHFLLINEYNLERYDDQIYLNLREA